MKNKLWLWTLLALFLTSCAPATAEATKTRTLQPSATATETPEPTITLVPTRTPTATWTPYPTYTPLPLSTPSDFIALNWDFSPNGEWVSWSTEVYGSDIGEFEIVERTDKSHRWVIAFDRKSYSYNDVGIGPIHWSIDGNFLYYVVSPSFSGGLGGLYSSLYRFDLRSGESEEVIPEKKNFVYAMGITPNHERLAYISIFEDQPPIIVRDLETDIEKSFSLKEYPEDFSIGEIFWSPAGDSFAFVMIDHSEENFHIDFIHVDIASLESKVLVRFEDTSYPHLWGWEEVNTLDVYISGSNYRCHDWLLDVETGAISAAYPDCEKTLDISYPDATPQP